LRRAAQVLDDFVRNFLREAGLGRTLEQFETEWHEVSQRRTPAPRALHANPCSVRFRAAQLAAAGTLTLEGFSPVPDMYVRSQELEAAIKARASRRVPPRSG